MPIDLAPFASFLADYIDDLPTEATFRGQTVNVRFGESPKMREMLIAGFQNLQSAEVLMKAEDVETEPANGETLTVGDTAYKIGTVTPLVSITEPAGYRLTISKTV